jgi:prepilin-type N-terminal cleavage/methylation domain-containing protein
MRLQASDPLAEENSPFPRPLSPVPRPPSLVTRHPSLVTRSGFTLIELLLALSLGALVLTAVGAVVGQALQARAAVAARNELARQARFALARMTAAVEGTTRLLVPLAENPATAWSEAVRDPGVLAVTLDPRLDRNGDGFADADNDKDGRVDEDSSADATNDAKSGILGIDDDGDGLVDEGAADDNDEDGATGEDIIDGLDNDGDGSVDEDTRADMNGDNQPGIAGVDDDGDGSVDEGGVANDDEDSKNDEDWLDPVVYRLNGMTLVERMPNLNPASGADFTERPLAENVSAFRVQRVPGARAVLVAITLELTSPGGEIASLSTRVRVGGGL